MGSVHAATRDSAGTRSWFEFPPSFIDHLWPEFVALDEALCEHLDAVAEKVIGEAISGNTSEAEVIGRQLPG